MSQDLNHAPDPLRPPEPDAEPGLWRWLVAAVLVLVIIVGSYQAYQWLVNDVQRRRAVAEAPPSPAAPARPATMTEPAPGPAVGGTARPAPPSAPLAEGPAPAVTGEAIHKCVVDGQVTYTNQSCPDGATGGVLQAAGEDPNGVTGSAGDGLPTVVVARPASLSVDDPSQRGALCSYLTAEIGRLDFEFKQPLPPSVLDHISSQLASLRAQHGAAKCDPLPKAAPDKAAPAERKRAPAKVVEEKRAD